MGLPLCQGSHVVDRQPGLLTRRLTAVLQAMRFFQKADDLADQLAANQKKNSKMSALMKAADSASQQPGLGRSVTLTQGATLTRCVAPAASAGSTSPGPCLPEKPAWRPPALCCLYVCICLHSLCSCHVLFAWRHLLQAAGPCSV